MVLAHGWTIIWLETDRKTIKKHTNSKNNIKKHIKTRSKYIESSYEENTMGLFFLDFANWKIRTEFVGGEIIRGGK